MRLDVEALDVDQLLVNDPARRSVLTLACMAASVAAVVTVLSVPGWLASAGSSGPGQPLPPAPVAQVETIGTRDWASPECPAGTSHCGVPSVLDLDGTRYEHATGHRQAVRQRDVASRTLVTTVSAASGRRWLLVGAEGSSSASALSVRFDGGDATVLLPGTLTFLPVPGHQPRVQVTVADYGRSGAGELLRVEEYDAVG